MEKNRDQHLFSMVLLVFGERQSIIKRVRILYFLIYEKMLAKLVLKHKIWDKYFFVLGLLWKIQHFTYVTNQKILTQASQNIFQ